MEGYSAIAAALTGLAEWAEDALAGGEPARHVAQQSYERTRHIAFLATLAGSGRLTGAALAGLLQGDQGDGETMTLGRPRPVPEPSGWRRAWRKVRREISGARTWIKG